LTLGCFLVANTANAVFAALLTPLPPGQTPASAPKPPAARSWSDRQKILDRNLFNASLLATAPLKEVDGELQATKLPLELLGTVASPDPQLSWAAIQDEEERKHLVLQVDDDVKEGKAKVIRIERKRVVLSENGELRELVLAAKRDVPLPPKTRAGKRSGGESTMAGSRLPARQLPSQLDIEQLIRDPAQFLSQAHILPKFEDGAMVGVEVNTIQAGSLFEGIGIEDGDVITEINGIKIDGTEKGISIMQELSKASELLLTIQDGIGRVETLNVPIPGR
jgi:general secretion pathway protein C